MRRWRRRRWEQKSEKFDQQYPDGVGRRRLAIACLPGLGLSQSDVRSHQGSSIISRQRACARVLAVNFAFTKYTVCVVINLVGGGGERRSHTRGCAAVAAAEHHVVRKSANRDGAGGQAPVMPASTRTRTHAYAHVHAHAPSHSIQSCFEPFFLSAFGFFVFPLLYLFFFVTSSAN